ncbi:uncharacterized protein [Saccopteryx bilineata]|uniref:uncharacterized protein n=1 Tax=Saccopteryx bilineata TaxID=59482 RepID=UPI00338F61FE
MTMSPFFTTLLGLVLCLGHKIHMQDEVTPLPAGATPSTADATSPPAEATPSPAGATSPPAGATLSPATSPPAGATPSPATSPPAEAGPGAASISRNYTVGNCVPIGLAAVVLLILVAILAEAGHSQRRSPHGPQGWRQGVTRKIRPRGPNRKLAQGTEAQAGAQGTRRLPCCVL